MANQPTPAEMREEILNSHPDQWTGFDPEPTWVLKSNRDFSIRLLRQYSPEERKIDQPDWASRLPNPTASKDYLRVEFRGAPIDQLQVIELDESRVTIVHPRREINEDSGEQELYLTEYEAQLSRIMSLEDFDWKLNQIDVTVR